MKVLLFEDDQLLSSICKQKLDEAKINCLVFEYPPENLIETILTEKPNLIIMSVIMPHMDGFTATEKIRADKRTKDTPLVFLTNLCQPENIKRGMDLGALKHFITAHITPSELVEEIKKLNI